MIREALIVPGLHGSPDGHWQTVLERQMSRAHRVEQDDWDAPVLDRWLQRLLENTDAHPGAIAVAHSLGCILIAHAARRYPRLKLGGALLVAPADTDEPVVHLPQLRNFAPIPTEPLPFPAIVVASSTDAFMALPRARLLAAAWGAEFINLGDAGHINIDAGFGQWPAARGLIATLEARIGEKAFAS